MTLEELAESIKFVNWFSKLGAPIRHSPDGLRIEQIPNLSDWATVTGILGTDPVPRLVERGMEWLPTQRDAKDPVHGELLEERSRQLGKAKEHARSCLEIYKIALSSLRNFQGDPLLKVGPHNFAESARGAALFAARRAAHETLLSDCGFWCSVMSIYGQGHWPLGMLPDGEIVVL